MIEQWQEIPGYEGQYMVSNTGFVKALAREIEYLSPLGKRAVTMLKERILRPYESCGYKKVDLYKNSIRKKAFIHILVAEAFIQNIDKKPQVNHKDGNRQNCHIDNLEWCTQKENVRHAIDVLKRVLGGHPPRGKDSQFSIPVLQFNHSGQLIREWGAMADVARECGFKGYHISNCCKGKSKTAYGFIWAFKHTA